MNYPLHRAMLECYQNFLPTPNITALKDILHSIWEEMSHDSNDKSRAELHKETVSMHQNLMDALMLSDELQYMSATYDFVMFC